MALQGRQDWSTLIFNGEHARHGFRIYQHSTATWANRPVPVVVYYSPIYAVETVLDVGSSI